MVHREIVTLFGEKKMILRQTNRAVTPYGGLSVFFEYLRNIKYVEVIERYMPFRYTSPNGINPVHIFSSFIISVIAGARRFAHTTILRADRALQAMAGITRYPTDDTIRNFFKRFGMSQIQAFFEPLFRWQIERLPKREEGYSLDLDSTVFERYGQQEGAKKGHNPKKHGRTSHHPILGILAEAYFVVHGWLRSGNCGSARGVVEFMKEVLSLLKDVHKIRCVRADSGFFDQKFLQYLEGESISYIIAARLTCNINRALKSMAYSIKEWRIIDENYAVGEFHLSLSGWNKERRFVVVREKVRDTKQCFGRTLIDVPGYTFRIFVTNRKDSPEEIWRDYNRRADCEKRIEELKYDLAADDFCMKKFFATEAAFRSVLLLFNLLSEYQRVIGMSDYKQPATLRTLVFLCGAILGKSGHNIVMHLSSAWGGLASRNSFFNNMLSYVFPTSPKLHQEVIT